MSRLGGRLGPGLNRLTGLGRGWIYPLLAVVLSLAIAGILMAATGIDPFAAYAALFEGSLGSAYGRSVTLVRTTPLLLAGLGVVIAFRAGVFNIGAEGQIYAGAVTATLVAVWVPGPALLIMLAAVIAGFIGGAAWAFVPGWLRAFRGVSEIVVTLMFNFIAIVLVAYLVNAEYGPMGERGAAYAKSPPVPVDVQLPIIWSGTGVHAGLLLGLIGAVAIYLFLRATPGGFGVRMIGSNPEVARYAGLRVPAVVLTVMLVSGGFAGLAGASEVLGVKYALFADFSPGYGYDAIAVALLARNNPIGAIVSALFFGAMRAGAVDMQQAVGVESSFILVIQALVIVFLAIGMIGRRGQPRPAAAIGEATG